LCRNGNIILYYNSIIIISRGKGSIVIIITYVIIEKKAVKLNKKTKQNYSGAIIINTLILIRGL